MKLNSKKILLLPLIALLSSCNIYDFFVNSSNSSSYSSSQIVSSSSEFSYSFKNSSSESSSISETSRSLPQSQEFNIYAVNDFHGSILERQNGYYYEGGMAKVFGYLKKRKDEDPNHTIILSSGDMYQGSYESNRNFGKVITEAMNYVGFTASTLGNHDFDYGLRPLYENIDLANFKFLGGNIVNYKDNSDWNVVDGSLIFDSGDYKIGIIGNIGEGQTSSIISSVVKDLSFLDPTSYIKNAANSLKQQGCAAIISCLHDGVSEAQELGDLSNYIDCMLCAHTHKNERQLVNNIPYIQGACNGEYITHIKFTISNDSIVNINTYENIAASSSWSEDQGILEIQNRYLDETYQTKITEQLGTISGGTYLSSTSVACLCSKAIYNYVSNRGIEVALAMENSQRASLPTPFTYSDLYKATPFTNHVIVINVSGKAIKSEAKYCYTYTGNLTKYSTLNDSTYYKIAVIDYLAYHMNTLKHYDYFSELNNHPERIIADYDVYPVDMAADYIKDTLGGIVNRADFQTYSTGMNIFAS